MSEDSPFRIGIIVMPLGPPKPDAFGIKDRDGKQVAWLSLRQIEEALAKWHELAEARRASLSNEKEKR